VKEGTATGSFLREIVVARGLVGWPQEGMTTTFCTGVTAQCHALP
jgi:hypothetical protein